jgi:hypothetical protein
MKIDDFLKNLSMEELLEVQSKSSSIIHNFKDGYFYICKVRSYGRNWRAWDIYNFNALQELCYQYYGEEGIVDVYSNNPDLSKLDNYGVVMFVPSVEDHQIWMEYTYLKNSIPEYENELKAWEERENVPFRERPYFAPIHTREDIDEQILKLENFDMSFIAPVSVKYVHKDDEE